MKTAFFITIAIFIFLFFAGDPAFSEPDKYGRDRNTNKAVIAEKAKKNNAYQLLLDLAEDYQLVFGIRKYDMGKDAKKNETLQQGYSWDFLTDREDRVLDQHIECLVKNWRVFPPEFIKKTGLNGILFMKNLKWHGMDVYGFELTDVVLLVNITPGGTLFFPGDDWFLYGIYHEFFHLIQNRFYSNKNFINYDEWDKLNPPGFHYHEGGTMGLLQEFSGSPGQLALLHKEHPEQGFVSRYATGDHWHDTTETFCSLFVASRFKKTLDWMKNDQYLRAKITYMILALGELYPGFTMEFFRKIHGVE